MENIITVIDNNLNPETGVLSLAIIEGEKNIVYSSENWNINKDIDKLNSIWNAKEPTTIKISGVKYIIIQITQERLIATTSDKKGSIIAFKDEERKIICKIAPDKMLALGIAEVSRSLNELSSKKPYMDLDTRLGKVEQLKWATPRILLDDTNNLQELGLIKFGLSIEEAKVYLALLDKGKNGAKVGELNEELAIKRTTIYRIIERLISKDWIVKLPLTPKSAQLFVARPLTEILDERIQEKEEELKILKSFRYIMGDLLENGWIDVSEMKKDHTFEILGIEKDCGLIIFEYEKKVKEEVIIRAALQLSSEKMREPIQPDLDKKEFTIEDLDDIKIEDTKIQNYLGMVIYFKFKEGTETGNNIGTDWIVAARHVAVPIENKVYVVWGSEEKFPVLLNTILKL